MRAIFFVLLFFLLVPMPSFPNSKKAHDLKEKAQRHEAATQAEISSIKHLVRTFFPDEGGSYVFGTAQVAIDRAHSLVFNKTISEPEGKTVQEKTTHHGKQKVSDLKGFEVVLCSPALRDQIDLVVEKYARRYGWPVATFKTEWPAIREQAKELMLDMVPVVNGLSPRITETNDLGEFEIKDVPKGQYCLFGYLVTKEVAMYWVQDIEANGRTPVRFDFLRDNSIVLWSKNKVAPTTSPAQMQLVPPPPPVPIQ